MGALIATRGTRRLVTHYNHIFNSAQIGGTRTTIINDNAPNGLYPLFTTPSKSARMIRAITQRNNLFLPLGAGHPHLLQRWDYYLQNEFDQTNQDRLRALIAQVLNLANPTVNQLGKNEDNRFYTAIRFECIEADPHANPPQAQTVLQSDEYDLLTNDTDDSGLDFNSAYSKIVLVTGPTASPTPIDAQ